MPIFKDECVYTFDNQESPYGVDVCLTCFIGTSPDPQHDFTKQHTRVSGHTAYLNLKKRALPHKTPRLEDFQDPKSKIPKLSVQPHAEEVEYEQHTQFKTLGSDDESQFTDVIDTVLKADSYTKTQEIESWELELNPCEHVAMFESLLATRPEKPSGYHLLGHCADCELNNNLWLCLECGNLGCGRRQFDGSGGNGHGVAHYEQTQHSLAAKLGSITPDGHVDVYCYTCNDDISDPNIRNHLSYWGVDIAKQTKTEKSMTELQLEQNLSWDFSASDSGEIVHGPGLTGMKNLGNSCYMNSVMQCLFNIPEFPQMFKPNDPSMNNLGGPDDLTTQLRKLSDGLISGRYDTVSPQMLRYLIGKGHTEFATARQQDAFEYLSYLLTQISQRTPGDLPVELFGFQSERRIACRDCNAVRYTTQNEENVSVAVPIVQVEGSGNEFKPVTMDQLLQIYTQNEEVESKCPKCGGSRGVSSMKFKSFPKYLVVNVRRFRLVNWVPQKVDVPVISSSEIHLDKYLSPGPQEHENVVTNEDTEEIGFVADPTKLSMLVSMGFSEDLCTEALRLASERGYGEGDFDAAVEILISGEAQQSLEAKPSLPKPPSHVDPESRAMLESMGFTQEQATAALERNSNMEAAVEWLFAGNFDTLQAQPERSVRDPSAPIGTTSLPADYDLSSLVCHKGASVHVGHYVSLIRKDGETFLFNDEKVTKGSDIKELEKFAYIYIFSRK